MTNLAAPAICHSFDVILYKKRHILLGMLKILMTNLAAPAIFKNMMTNSQNFQNPDDKFTEFSKS